MAKEDSSVKVPAALSSGVKASIYLTLVSALRSAVGAGENSVARTFHLSMSSVSQGFSCLCVEGILRRRLSVPEGENGQVCPTARVLTTALEIEPFMPR